MLQNSTQMSWPYQNTRQRVFEHTIGQKYWIAKTVCITFRIWFLQIWFSGWLLRRATTNLFNLLNSERLSFVRRSPTFRSKSELRRASILLKLWKDKQSDKKIMIGDQKIMRMVWSICICKYRRSLTYNWIFYQNTRLIVRFCCVNWSIMTAMDCNLLIG